MLIKKNILDRINKIKSDEDDFKSIWWKNNFVSYSKMTRQLANSNIPYDKWENYTKHISEVDFNELNDNDLVRIFEYIILERSDIVTNRINKQYFKK